MKSQKPIKADIPKKLSPAESARKAAELTARQTLVSDAREMGEVSTSLVVRELHRERSGGTLADELYRKAREYVGAKRQ